LANKTRANPLLKIRVHAYFKSQVLLGQNLTAIFFAAIHGWHTIIVGNRFIAPFAVRLPAPCHWDSIALHHQIFVLEALDSDDWMAVFIPDLRMLHNSHSQKNSTAASRGV
jgi:hypothetical protein